MLQSKMQGNVPCINAEVDKMSLAVGIGPEFEEAVRLLNR